MLSTSQPEQAQEEQKSWALPFFTVWGGQALSMLGSRAANFALIWWITQETGSAVILTTLAMVAFLPMIILGPIGGALVDGWNRRLIMIGADLGIALATGGLAIIYLAGQMQLWHIFVVTFVSTALGVFHGTAMMASTSLMVPEAHLTRVQGANQMLQGSMNILAPALGALLVSLMPLHYILGIDVLTAAFSILPLFFIAIPQPTKAGEPKSMANAEETKQSIWEDVRFGIRYIVAWPGLMFVVGAAMLLNLLLNPAFTLLPLLVTEHFGGGAVLLSWMEGLFGVGIISGGLLMGLWSGSKRRMLALPLGGIAVGIGVLALGTIPSTFFWVALVCPVLVGLGIANLDGTILAALQANVEPEVQGRVFTVLSSGAQAMTPIGLILVGQISQRWGVQVPFMMAGLLMSVIAIVLLLTPAVMRLHEGNPNKQPTEKDTLEKTPVLAPTPASSAT
ncbi:MAG: MFS transporter [Chloroflexota bacterium]